MEKSTVVGHRKGSGICGPPSVFGRCFFGWCVVHGGWWCVCVCVCVGGGGVRFMGLVSYFSPTANLKKLSTTPQPAAQADMRHLINSPNPLPTHTHTLQSPALHTTH